MGNKKRCGRASLESIVESGDLGLSILHPGGLKTTRELAELCQVSSAKQLLDVASGTGESACHLAEVLGCQVTGIDHSLYMVEKATRKAEERGLRAVFTRGDAHNLPFGPETFDAVISECTTCALEKQRAIEEMARVTKPGGHVGISDLYWKEGAPERLQSKLAELENERPESLAGWKALFERAGLQEVQTKDISATLAAMSKQA
jgi:SAM-dependent methyltransferase